MRMKNVKKNRLMRVCVIQYKKNLKTKPYVSANTKKVLVVFDLNQDKYSLLTLYKSK